MLGDILEHQFFSFELKKAVFYKILKESTSLQSKSFPKKKLDRMRTIRNIVAHGAIMAMSKEDFTNFDKLMFNHGGRDYPAKHLIVEYDQLREDVWRKVMVIANMPIVTKESPQEELRYREYRKDSSVNV